jgi:PTS system mannose-specific IID component
MLGSGFGFAILPGLRSLYAMREGELNAAAARHVDHFNTNPYLAGVALGAVLRMEADGADDDTVRRFKTALRGPLGSMGDALMWAGWLPTVAVVALALHWLGAAPWIVALVFLVLYNLVHVPLRLWGFVVGFEAGRDVAAQLVRADLVRRSVKLHPGAILAVGVVVGAAVAGDGGLADAGIGWFLLCAAAFVGGVLRGHTAWRPAAAATVVAVVALALYGVIS